MPLPRSFSLFSFSSSGSADAQDPPQANDGTYLSSSSLSPSSSLPSLSTAAAGEPSQSQHVNRNRRKREQKKKAKARRRTLLAPGEEDGEGLPELVDASGKAVAPDADDDDPLEVDELDLPEADEDTTYLDRHVALLSMREEDAAAEAEARAKAKALDDPVDLPSTKEGMREAVEAAARRRLAENKKKKAEAAAAAVYPARVKLPPGAGQVEGMPDFRSTPERVKAIEAAGFVPLLDERGMLRMGVRVNDEVVLVHQPGGKEPIMLRM
ncbi:hypothetical protein JCM10213_007488 [Rhodosporidiobolus nylandii]